MYRIGIDIGGTFVKAGVVAEDYSILGRASRPTGIGRPLETVIDDIPGRAIRIRARWSIPTTCALKMFRW